MRVAVVQLASTTDSEANRALIDERLSGLRATVEAATRPDLIVLPEASMHDFGSPDHPLGPSAEPLDGPFVATLSGHARASGATIVAGMFESSDTDADIHAVLDHGSAAEESGNGRRPFNTLVVCDPSGEVVAHYRKIHLYDSFGYRESDRLVAGDLPVTIRVADSVVGLMTCYDLRFPELARDLIDRGADTLVVPAAWVAGPDKLHHWRTLVTARAIENTVHVVAAAQGGERYTGHSLIVDPMGATLLELGDGAEESGQAVVDPQVTAEARHTNPSLQNRRFHQRGSARADA